MNMTAYHKHLLSVSKRDADTLAGLILKDLFEDNPQTFDLFEEYEEIGKKEVYEVVNKLLNN